MSSGAPTRCPVVVVGGDVGGDVVVVDVHVTGVVGAVGAAGVVDGAARPVLA